MDKARAVSYYLMTKFACVLMLAALACAQEPNTVPLWPGAVDPDSPTLTVFLPVKNQASGTGVIVCPGGSYSALASNHEGRQVANWLNSMGISAFVLKYRLGPRYHHPVELGDAQRAIRMVRARAREFGVIAERIGMMGFSAGGHLTATAGTHFDAGKPDSSDPIERAGSRPDFLVLGYAVISLSGPYAHQGSRRNLLGDNPDP